MKLKKALLVTGAASTIGLASMVGVVSAQSTTTDDSTDNGMQSLVQKIAEKFNLDEKQVQSVFDKDRSEHEAEMQQRDEERLTQAVTDGKITSEQKDKILAKQKELKAYMDSIKDKTESERHTLMDTKRDEVKQWASDNDIPEEYMHFMGGHGGPGKGNAPPSDSDSSTQ
jgi:Skp family chaperone for outer membrane proteins